MNKKDLVDQNPEYWSEYSNLQFVKHRLIQSYLNGWFPKLGSWSGRIIFIDTHAGRGKHRQGQFGSPLIALSTLLQHSHRDKLLDQSEVLFLFIERDEENAKFLNEEIKALGSLPEKIRYQTVVGDSFTVLSDLLSSLRERGQNLAPAFIFVDPYGFKISGKLLFELMTFPRVELFINVIWRWLDMARSQSNKPHMAKLLNDIFYQQDWKNEINSEDFDERADQAAKLFQKLTLAKWSTSIRMLGENNKTKYLLLHLTNHPSGRELMKDCIWKICPDGGFYARKSDNPNQQYLITPEPNLTPLRDWVLGKIQVRPWRYKELLVELRSEIWRDPHLNDVIRQLRNEKMIYADSYTGRFGPKSNPLLYLSR